MLAGVALLAALQAPAGDGVDALRARVAAQPAAVREFIARRAMCNHWLGEEPYDRERRGEIERAVRTLGCATADGEEIFLRRHFADRSEILALLDETRDILAW